MIVIMIIESKQSAVITGEVSKVANDCLLLAEIYDFVIEFNSSQASRWKRCNLLCVLHQSAARYYDDDDNILNCCKTKQIKCYSYTIQNRQNAQTTNESFFRSC